MQRMEKQNEVMQERENIMRGRENAEKFDQDNKARQFAQRNQNYFENDNLANERKVRD